MDWIDEVYEGNLMTSRAERLLEAHLETGRTINRLSLTLLGVGLVSTLTVGFPDSYFFTTEKTVSVPLAGGASLKTLLILGPIVLIAIRAYLEVYVAHWRRLDRLVRRSPTARNMRLPVVSPLRHPLLRLFSGFVLFPLVPLVLGVFTYGAMANREWGVGMLFLLLASSAVLALHRFSWPWPHRYIVPPIALLVVFKIVDNFNGFDEFRRPFDLQLANLERTILNGQDLRSADLVGAKLNESDLGDAQLIGANLTRAQLKQADLYRAQLLNADATKAQLQGAELIEARLDRINFREARLEGADLSNASLVGADLRDAQLGSANFGRANSKDANLAGAQLQNSDLRGANLEGVSLRGLQMKGANLSGLKLRKFDLLEVKLEGAMLQEAKLEGADLSGADLRKANLFMANLEGALLDAAELNGAYLHAARMAETIMRGTRLEGADLSGAEGLVQPQLNEACGDSFTILPKGLTIPTCPPVETSLPR